MEGNSNDKNNWIEALRKDPERSMLTNQSKARSETQQLSWSPAQDWDGNLSRFSS